MPKLPICILVIRDYDGYVYLREWSGGIIGGGFEPLAKPVFHDGVPEKFEYQLLNEDWDHFRKLSFVVASYSLFNCVVCKMNSRYKDFCGHIILNTTDSF